MTDARVRLHGGFGRGCCLLSLYACRCSTLCKAAVHNRSCSATLPHAARASAAHFCHAVAQSLNIES